MPDFNSMQANLGLVPGANTVMGPMTPTAGQTSMRLMEQAQQQKMVAQQTVVSSVGAQFQRQLQMVQAQQSMNPYAAQMMSGMMPGGQGYMPSPLTMTPANTGVFRPPAPPPMAAIPPMYRPPMPLTPFQPRMPTPMFQSAYDQNAQLQDLRSNQMFSYASQAPGVAGQGLGIAAGAALGARYGRRFGRYGMMAGAVGGGLLAGASGVASGIGDAAQSLMGPTIEQRQMGAGIQNMSRSWVVGGPSLHAMGQGLSRDASIEMAGEVRNLAGESGFQKQTGNMFNRFDLMKMMNQGGERGLFDMAQSIPQIKQQLRETASTVKQFMELTNNPDVATVIRDMGRLRQFGMTQQDMLVAAQGMKAYSRAAGTTIGGLQQMGGLPGAMTFQQAGLTAGTGFQYGNFAAASARQMVASGDISSRQLALMGGVQGITQRDIQAQAAFSSMPLFAASNAQFGAQGWGVNQGGIGQTRQGAFGMVQGSLQALNQATRRGGIGALATFPLMQRQIADEATAAMTPEQAQAQRFSMGMQTGRRLGLRGEGAAAAGFRLLYGDEVGEQMLMQAKSPGYWRGQQQGVQRRRRELDYTTRERMMADAPILGGVPRDIGRGLGITGEGSWGADVGDFFGRVGGGLGAVGETMGETAGAVGGLFSGAVDWVRDRAEFERTGTVTQRMGRAQGARVAGLRAGKGTERFAGATAWGATPQGRAGAGMEVDNDALLAAYNEKFGGRPGGIVRAADAVTNAATMLGMGIPGVVLGALSPIDLDLDLGSKAAVAGISLSMDVSDQMQMVRDDRLKADKFLDMVDRAKREGGKKSEIRAVSKSLEEAMGNAGKGMGRTVLRSAADKIDRIVSRKGAEGTRLNDTEMRGALMEAVADATGKGPAEVRAIVTDLYKDPAVRRQFESQAQYFGKKDSRDLSAWGGQEGGERTRRANLIGQATKRRLGVLQESISGVEDTLGLGSTFGVYSGEERELQGVAGEVGGKRLAQLAAYARAYSGDPGDRDASMWTALQKKDQLTDKQQEALGAQLDKFRADYGEDFIERLGGLGGRGTTEEIAQYGTAQQLKGLQSAFTSKGFMGKFGRYSSKLEAFAETGGMLTAQNVAAQFTEADLSNMARSGGQAGRVRATMLRKAQAGDEQALGQLQQIAVEQADIGKEGVEKRTTVTAEGTEAQRLDASEKALDDMSATFRNFAPAAKDFKEGAAMFRDAMEAGQILVATDD